MNCIWFQRENGVSFSNFFYQSYSSSISELVWKLSMMEHQKTISEILSKLSVIFFTMGIYSYTFTIIICVFIVRRHECYCSGFEWTRQVVERQVVRHWVPPSAASRTRESARPVVQSWERCALRHPKRRNSWTSPDTPPDSSCPRILIF